MNESITFFDLSQLFESEDERQLWQHFLHQAKGRIPGTNQEKQNIIRKRILKFYQNYKLQGNRYYLPRRELNFNNTYEIVQTSILIYGIDLLPKEVVTAYINCQHAIIEVHDESHIMVVFRTINEAIQFLYDKLAKPEMTYQKFIVKFQKNEKEALIWRELQHYQDMCYLRQIYGRFLTTQDVQCRGRTVEDTLKNTYRLAIKKFIQDYLKQEAVEEFKFQMKDKWARGEFRVDKHEKSHITEAHSRVGKRERFEREVSRSKLSKYKNQITAHSTMSSRIVFNPEEEQRRNKGTTIPGPGIQKYMERDEEPSLYEELLKELDVYHITKKDKEEMEYSMFDVS